MGNRDSFIFYGSFYEAISCLDDATRLQCYDAVASYAITGIDPELNGVAKAIFALIKPQIDANNKRYNNGCKGAEYGKKGGRPVTKNPIGDNDENPIGDTSKNPIGVNDENPKETPNEKENENVNENENEKEKENESPSETKREKQAKEKRTRFSAPSVDEVRDYCRERGNSIDAETFVDFYASKGWKVGNSPMKDWQSAIRTWEKRECRASPREKPASFNANDYLQGIIQGGA
nr:MAG TPA: hypothetical protein [Bacteriophage sp.]